MKLFTGPIANEDGKGIPICILIRVTAYGNALVDKPTYLYVCFDRCGNVLAKMPLADEDTSGNEG